MSTKMFILMFFYLMCNELICTKKIEEIFACTNETECDEVVERDTLEELASTTVESIYNSTSTTNTASTQVTKIQALPTTQTPRKMTYNNSTRNNTVHKIQSDVCDCDLTTSSCDINCCCDEDCTDFHLTVFSYCENQEPEIYDKRYCYSRNFIERNNTPFVLDKLANNLFCILYDNLPPTYSVTHELDIKTEKDLREAMNPKKLMWRFQDQLFVPEYNISSSYKDGDVIWKIHNNYIEPLELLQSGFTELCAFKKTINYLREWKGQCLQTELSNTNKFLFPKAFNNFTIITSPHLFNETYFNISDQICPRNVCLPWTNHYCNNSWKTCNNTVITGSCLNTTCYNVVKGVKYMFVHNGSVGIDSGHIYFNIGNVSRSFYQQFEVMYEWAGVDKERSFSLSGNPGYMFEKPLIIGTLKINKTNDNETRYISFNKTNSFLTLPIATRSGECEEINSYTVGFGEDIKLRCSVSVSTNNFSTSSCIELQNRTMHFLMKNTLFNVTQTDQYSIYVSKTGNFTTNDTADWAQILLDRVPHNNVTGQLIGDRLYCSGLITSMHLNILYAALPKPETLTNYNILGIGIIFSNESDAYWSKCMTENCMDILKIDIVNYVTFHDISKPSKYYFAASPYLDLTLPYDFFYPFLSSSKCIETNIFLISGLVFMISLHSSFY